MDAALISKIELMINKIDEQEVAYRAAIEAGRDYDTLRLLRRQIRAYKEELNGLEQLLYDEFKNQSQVS